MQRIQQILDPIVELTGNKIFIAPLNEEHFNRYIQIISNSPEPGDLVSKLRDFSLLQKYANQVDVRTDISIDTNVYVINSQTPNPSHQNSLSHFELANNENYIFYLLDDSDKEAYLNPPVDRTL